MKETMEVSDATWEIKNDPLKNFDSIPNQNENWVLRVWKLSVTLPRMTSLMS